MTRYARVVVDVGPAHLDRPFDYLVPDDLAPEVALGVGSRVRVSFHGRPRTAWVLDVVDEPSVDPARVKPLTAVDGAVRWFDEDDVAVWRWVADRYAGTLSGAIAHALPPRIARVEKEMAAWPSPAPVSAADRPPCASTGWRDLDGSALLKAAAATPVAGEGRAFHLRPPLHVDLAPLLVDLISRTLSAGRTALVVTPSPAPGPADDLPAALGPDVVDLRGMTRDADRYRAFLRMQRGDIRVAIGGRGLALTPMPDLGLLVVLDEANPALKEQRNPRHHVRDAVLARGRMTGAPVVLTSTVPSAHLARHLEDGHVTPVRADRVSERRLSPAMQVIDRKALPPKDRRTRIVGPITRAIADVVARDGTVVVLAAAKGSGSALACTRCRGRVECRTCGAGVSARQTGADGHGDGDERWACHVCDWSSTPFPCVDCGEEGTFPLRAGAKRLAADLAKTHPDADVAHMEGFDQPGPTRRPAIAVMTRGSVVARPGWLRGPDGPTRADLLVVADPDVLLGRPLIDAAEDAVRLWFDGAAIAEQVMVQTAQTAHPAIQAFIRLDPDGFWRGEAERRQPLGFPPAGSLLRLTGVDQDAAQALRAQVPGSLLGPDEAGVALLKTDGLRGTLSALRPLREQWARDDRRIRVDVDPVVAI